MWIVWHETDKGNYWFELDDCRGKVEHTWWGWDYTIEMRGEPHRRSGCPDAWTAKTLAEGIVTVLRGQYALQDRLAKR